MAKRGLSEDLQKLMAKREDIEKLQQTLMGIIQHSSSKKIDVDDLKSKLAESVRRDKYSHPFAAGTNSNADITLKKGRMGAAAGRSKSPIGYNQTISNTNLMHDSSSSNINTIKMYDQKDSTPAWYKSLKKNIN